MEAKTFGESLTVLRNEGILVDSSKLKGLVEDMQESLKTDYCLDYSLTNRFSRLNGIYNPFGYDLKRGKRKRSFYRYNRLRQKLIRIQKEIKFVKKNIKRYQKLTLREKEIFQLLTKGLNNPEIAEQLFISRCTVEQHRKHINHKLQIKSFPQLLRFGYAFDLI